MIWDNASPDGTAEYLRSLDEPRIRVVMNPENIGQNAYAPAFGLTRAPYLIELDDDVVNAPPEWDEMLLDAFKRLPHIGFLAADLEDDPHDLASRYRHHIRPHEYTLVEENGVNLLTGPAGGGCAMTSRELNQRVGGFRQSKKHVFWLEDAAYIADLEKIGFGAAVLSDLKVHHTGGPHYTKTPKEKAQYWQRLPGPTGAEGRGQAGAPPDPVRAAPQRALRLVRAALLGAAAFTSTSPGTSRSRRRTPRTGCP